MNNATYTPEQMKLSAQFAQAWNRARADKRPMFEALMSAVILGMEVAEHSAAPMAPEQAGERESA